MWLLLLLPPPLLLLPLPAACAQLALAVDTILPLSLSAATTLAIPAAAPAAPLVLSVALCTAADPPPSFATRGPAGSTLLVFDRGVATLTGLAGAGNTLLISVPNASAGAPWSLEVGVSTGAPLHRALPAAPLLGDTSASQALLFSPPFAPPPAPTPAFPNYTLPDANASAPAPPPALPNATLILAPTAQLQQHPAAAALANSACALRAASRSTAGPGAVNASAVVLRDAAGWRAQWLVEGLSPNTNYTAWVVQQGGALAGPIYALTKSAAFACPLVHSLPFCPLTSYAVPLPPPPDGASTYSAPNLPANISAPLLSTLTNFSIALLTFPCGRDVYSPLQSCASCADAYRTWACAVSLPRCAELPPSLPSPGPTPALLPSSPQSRIPSNSSYTELLPCIESCNAVDRACPPLVSWVCPAISVNANASYGIGFIDSSRGVQGKGSPGVAQDQWGVAWCNG